MSRKSSEASSKNEQSEGGIFQRLVGIPVVSSALSLASSSYNKVKDTNAVAKIGLSFAELSIKTAVNTTKFAYNVVPKPGFVHEVEQKVSQADSFACKGLDVIQSAFPYVMNDTEQIISSGVETLEKSEVLEAALIVSEAAIDYIHPAKSSVRGDMSQPSTVSIKKVDRLIDVSCRTGSVLYEGGSKAFWGVTSVPWNVTKSGYNMVTGVMSYVPGISAFVPSRRRLRRSNRRRVKTKPEDVLSFPFPVSPEKKRKRSHGESGSESGELYELVYVDKPYDSDDDPDYCPTCDHDGEDNSGSESSDTVGGSDEEDEEGDSGEGDEADSSPVGGKCLTPEEIKKSPKNAGNAQSGQAVLVVHIKENKEAREKKKRTGSTEIEAVDSHPITTASNVTTAKVEQPKSKETTTDQQSPKSTIANSPPQRRRHAREASGKENVASANLNGAQVHLAKKSPPVSSANGNYNAASANVNGAQVHLAAKKSPPVSGAQGNYASKVKKKSPEKVAEHPENETMPVRRNRCR